VTKEFFFPSERDVPFARPEVKSCVTKAYRLVYVLREWIIQLSDAQRKPLANGRTAGSPLLQALFFF
jgi:hypothetical protein